MPKVCPKCRNRRVHLWSGRGGGQMYKCPNCGYVGAAAVEFPDNALKKLQKAERMRTKFRQQRKERLPR